MVWLGIVGGAGESLILHVPPFKHGDALVARKSQKEKEEKKNDPKNEEGLGMDVCERNG
jgi:hypothetical protein